MSDEGAAVRGADPPRALDSIESPLDREAAATADVSVVIPTHERPEYLPELLAALESQTLPLERFEVVIVDDASQDAVWGSLSEAVSASRMRLRAFRLPSNVGPAAARNAGARLARAPLIVFLDDDCLPSPGWAASFINAFADGADLVQGHTRADPAMDTGPFGRTIWVTGESWLFETCNIGYRKSSFESLGGFDEARPDVTRGSRPHFGEDAELGWRLKAAGMRTSFSPDALAYHRVYPTTFVEWLSELRRRSLFPGLVRRCPGMRTALFARVFLSKETAAFDLAFAGGVATLGLWNPWPLIALLPWLAGVYRRARPHRGRPLAMRLAQFAAGDVVGFVSLLKGSITSGSLVL
jgi:GT2 family glycosyltransferase